MSRGWLAVSLAVLLPATASATAAMAPAASQKGPSVVRVIEADGVFQLHVDGQPFRIKGAGLEMGSLEALRERGGNSFRTWRPDNGKESGRDLLDRAHALGLRVTLGIDVARERHGFDYNDNAAVARQLARVKSEVLQYKDHPALLMWAVGNELNLGASNPRAWNAVEQLARMIHEVDPNHPVMTTLAGFDRAVIDNIKSRAPSLDLIGIQLYGDIAQLAAKLEESDWKGPYVVTEWGPTGHWEIGLTSWGAPIEDDSSRKAEVIRERYQRYIATDQRQGLGSYVFLWGQKQERTPTWYGLFLSSGESTAAVDTMQYLWTGRWPANQSPAISPVTLDARAARDSVRLVAGRDYSAGVQASDVDGDSLEFRWRVMRESTATSAGGDHEDVPKEIAVRMQHADSSSIRLRAPSDPGTYRLFVTVLDGKGHAAHANFPFKVERGARR